MGKSSDSKQLRTRLTAYSTTAAAALIVAPAAEGALHNITDGLGGNLLVNGSHTAPPDLNFHSRTAGVGMSLTLGPFKALLHGFNYYSGGGLGSAGMGAGKSPFAANVFFFNTGSGGRNEYFVKNCAFGALVSGEGGFQNAKWGYMLARGFSSEANAQFNIGPGANAHRTGYVALRTTVGANQYYGWLRVKVSNGPRGYPDEISLVDKSGDGIFGAYGLKADQITVGATAVPEPSTFELSGLGLLAMGAAGIRELRRRRQGKPSATGS